MITITAFRDSPDRGRGLARDMRVRWALEEVGAPYAVRLFTFDELKTPAYRALQPFGQIPAFEEDGLRLFETGAIVLHLAETRPGIWPEGAAERARARSWLFAALSTLEPPILQREVSVLTERDRPWHAERMPAMEARIHARLADLATALGEGPWLVGDFSAADLMTAGVLMRLGSSGLLDAHPALAAYLARAQARPAYGRAFEAQRQVFLDAQARGEGG